MFVTMSIIAKHCHYHLGSAVTFWSPICSQNVYLVYIPEIIVGTEAGYNLV